MRLAKPEAMPTEHTKRQDIITHILYTALYPKVFHITNESHRHQQSPNAASHFKITVVAEAFQGLGLAARHQKVYALLATELQNGLHALSMALYTPEEWQHNPRNIPSPPCRHSK